MSASKKKSAADAAGALVPKRTSEVSAEAENVIPLIIGKDPNARKIWTEANEDERNAGLLLCDFENQATLSEVLARFDFADKWNATFSRSNTKLYQRGMAAIVKAAKIAGVCKSYVYNILRITDFYHRDGYLALKVKAEANGVEIPWSHLRIIVERLENNKDARTKVEREIVQRRMTVRELEKFIDTIAPESIRKKGIVSEELSAEQHFDSMVGSFKKFSNARHKFEEAMEDLNDNFSGTVEQARHIIEQSRALIGYFEEIREFIDDKEAIIVEMQDKAQKYVDGKGDRKAVKKSADNIRKQITEETTQKQKKESARAAANVARGDIDDTEIADNVPILDDGPEFDGGSDPDDESTEPTNEELDEIDHETDDDDVEVDDDEALSQDIFDDIGNITRLPKTKTKR